MKKNAKLDVMLSNALFWQIIDLKRDPYGTMDTRKGKPTIKTAGNVPKNPLQTMEDKLRIANKVNKKYKELMNELDDNIKQTMEEIGLDEAKALLENKKVATNNGRHLLAPDKGRISRIHSFKFILGNSYIEIKLCKTDWVKK